MCKRCNETGQADVGHEIHQAAAGSTNRRNFLASSAATLAFALLPLLSTLAEAASDAVPAKNNAMASASADAAARQSQEHSMKIRMDVDGEIVTATLDDTAAGRDFAALLPLSLTLKDYADIERIADLPRKLDMAGAPASVKPETGDITYYAPWGNLAVFVEGGKGSSRGLVRLGRVHTGLPALQRPGPLKVGIERTKD